MKTETRSAPDDLGDQSAHDGQQTTDRGEGEAVDPLADRVERLVYAEEALVVAVNAPLHEFESNIHLIEPSIHLLEALIHLFKTFHHVTVQIVDGSNVDPSTGGENTWGEPSVASVYTSAPFDGSGTVGVELWPVPESGTITVNLGATVPEPAQELIFEVPPIDGCG